MKIIFLSMMFSDVETDIKRSTSPNSVSGHKFQENLIRGFEENDCNFVVVNIPRVRRYPDFPQIIFREERRTWGKSTKWVNVGFINLPLLNYVSQAITCYRAILEEIKKDKNEHYVLVTFNSNLHNCFAMLLARKLHKNITLCNVVGDLHGDYGIINCTEGLRGSLIRKAESMQDSIGKKSDSFVFLTKYMAQAMGVEQKPCCVMECLYAVDAGKLKPVHNEDGEEKIIFYAGSLCREYGIEHLLQTFSEIKNSEYRLQIAGQGDCEELVKQWTKSDSRISYLGFITPSEVEKRQQEATVLVSPRTSEHEFVKYSFASKTVECLASGKPYVAHRLPCDPPEYENYICYAEDETERSLADKLVQICSLSAEQRNELGMKNRKFVINEKNPKNMCSRIIEMLEGLTH